MPTTTTETIVRESPEIEAYKIGLIRSAKALSDQGQTIPEHLVAAMTQLQISAGQLAQAGIGGHQPYLQQAGYSLGDSRQSLGESLTGTAPLRAGAQGYLDRAGGGIQGQVENAQQGIEAARDFGLENANRSINDLNTSGDQARAYAAGAQPHYQSSLEALPGINTQAQNSYNNLTNDISGLPEDFRAGSGDIRQVLSNDLNSSTQAAQGHVDNALGNFGRSGQLGGAAAVQGINDLQGTTGGFDPSSIQRFSNPYEDAVVQQTNQDIARAGNIHQQRLNAQAVGAGAFGGSRQGVEAAGLQRYVLEQQARSTAQLRQSGYEGSRDTALQAFEQQQGRGQNAAALTGNLGAQGANSLYQAGQGIAGAGLAGEQYSSANAQAIAQTGLSIEQLAANTGLSVADLSGRFASQAANTGYQGQDLRSTIAGRGASTGLAGEDLAQRSAVYGGQAGQSYANSGIEGSRIEGSLGLLGQQEYRGIGEQYGNLATNFGNQSIERGRQQGLLGLQQAGIGQLNQQLGQNEQGFLYELGRQQQGHQQAQYDATRQTNLERQYEPHNRLSFLNDIYKGIPSSQQTTSGNSSPGVSPFQTFAGLGVAGLSAAAGAAQIG